MAVRWRPLFDGHVCSLGYELLDWIHTYQCHGPGDVQGEPLDYDDELRRFIVEAYELDPVTGRRLRDEVIFSRPKGRAKSEIAGHVAVAEMLGPVRFDGWDADGQPVGRPVRSPLIKCLATEESQAGNTFETVAYIAGEWGPDEHPDIYAGITGSRRYQSASALYLPDGGEARACTAGSASKDGGKETFVVADETHLYVLRELKAMYGTVRRNLPKRRAATPWLLQTSTAFRPGEQSVHEETMRAFRKGELGDEILVDHREASGRVNLADKAHTLKQLREVYGDAAAWLDLEHIYRTMRDPRVCPDEATAARYYLNRSIATKDAWIADGIVERQMRAEVIEPGTDIALGFDGSLTRDATVLRGCRMSDGYRFRIGVWSKPDGVEGIGWEVPRLEVLRTIREAYARYSVIRGYFDPHEWRSDIDLLAEEFGQNSNGNDLVGKWETRRDVAMAVALDRLHADMVNGSTFQDLDPVAVEHFGNAYVWMKNGHRLVRKEYPDSPRKIDTVVADTLAYEARADAIEAGDWPKPSRKVLVLR